MHACKTTLAVMALSLLATFTLAASDEPTDAAADCQLRVATGKAGKGYSRLFADIRAVCGAQVKLCEVRTEGGLQNLTTLAANQAELGFAPVDTLQEMKPTDESIAALVAVMPLNSNLLHIVTTRYGYTPPAAPVGKLAALLEAMKPAQPKVVLIEKYSDLKGLPVALVGSAQSLVRTLDRASKSGLAIVDVDTDEQGIAMLKSGKVAAMFTTSGWPSGPLLALKADSGIGLADFDLAAQLPNQLMTKNYPNLGVYRKTFLAPPNLLLSRPFKAGGPNGQAVAALQNCLAKNLASLQEGRFEPAWQEVKNVGETYGWPRLTPGAKR